jgi:dynein heavy chain, axonemal
MCTPQSIVGWWFDRDAVCAEVRARCDALVAATLGMYHTICAQLLPTPAQCHYTFNTRDLSKVFQGMQMAAPVPDTVAALMRCGKAARQLKARTQTTAASC